MRFAHTGRVQVAAELDRKDEEKGLHPENMRQAGWWRAWSDDEVDDGHIEGQVT
jgi:hypothetical protein